LATNSETKVGKILMEKPSSIPTISMDGYKTERKVSSKKSFLITISVEMKNCRSHRTEELFAIPKDPKQFAIYISLKKNAIIFQGPSSTSLNPACLSSPSLSFASSR
jgi:hypothetical protein